MVASDDADAPFAQEVTPQWASFPKPRTDRPYDAAVLVHDGSLVRRTDLHAVETNIPRVQPLPGGELLVVGARSRFREGGADLNGGVYGPDGDLRREFLLGDGINDVQVTSDGRIWVSYSDEGVFGNYGWGPFGGPEPIGASGLVRFNARGDKEWEYAAPPGIGGIDDCYALNVSNAVAWVYYYSSFPLVRIARDGSVEALETRFDAGAHRLAVAAPLVLFSGSHGEEALLGRIEADRVEQIVSVDLVLPGDLSFNRARMVGRDSKLHALVGDIWYQIDVRDLQASRAG